MTAPTAAHPLTWPANRRRSNSRQPSRFKVASFARVRDELLNELKLMNARRVVLSTNLRLRQDGIPLAGQPQPADPGVAVYFRYKGRDVCFACDRWSRVEDNMQAVRHTIAALRGIARWGTGDMVDAAFTGFAALPAAPPARPWPEVLGVSPHAPTESVSDAYRRLAKAHHPDRNPGDDGATARFLEAQAAFDSFRRERGL